jgi:hypothetical protein
MFAKYVITTSSPQDISVQQQHLNQLLILLKKSLLRYDFANAAKILSVLSRSLSKFPELITKVSVRCDKNLLCTFLWNL